MIIRPYLSFYHLKPIKIYNRTTKYYIRDRAGPFRQIRSKRFFYKHIGSYVAEKERKTVVNINLSDKNAALS